MDLQSYRPQQSTVHYNSPKSNSLPFRKGRYNQGCCVQGYKNHNCNTNEGCSYQGQNNQGLHFTGITINSRDVFFKDRFMLAPAPASYGSSGFESADLKNPKWTA